MAKKTQVTKPVISEIPMPISDSPLVIDLPDGQKLVVGKMSPGSVIEVATWRGTGRPDSRTSRLMLGMSSADQVQAQAQKKVEDETTKSRVKFNWRKPELKSVDFIGIGRSLSKLPAAVLARISIKNRINKNKSLSSQNLTSQNPTAQTLGSENFEIEAWLDQLTDKARNSSTKQSGKTASKPAAKKRSTKKSSR